MPKKPNTNAQPAEPTNAVSSKAGRKTVIDKVAVFKALQENPDLSQRSLRERFGGSPTSIKALRDEFFSQTASAVAVLPPDQNLLQDDEFGAALTKMVALIQSKTARPLQATIESLSADNARLKRDIEDNEAAQADYEKEVEAREAAVAAELDSIRGALAACKAREDKLRRDLEVTDAKLATLQVQYDKQLHESSSQMRDMLSAMSQQLSELKAKK